MWKLSATTLVAVVTLCCWTLTSGQDQKTYSPPKIEEPKFARTEYVVSRSSVTLQCNALGTPTPTYKWRYMGGNPPQEMALPAVAQEDPTTGTLVISDFTEREEGDYQCLASSEILPGKVISAIAPAYSVKMILLAKWPTVTKESTVRNSGEPASLTCKDPPRSQPPGIFKWFKSSKEGGEIPSSNRVYIDNVGGLHFSYTLHTDSHEDLQCAIFNQQINSINLGSPRRLEVVGTTLTESPPNILFFTQDAVAMRNEPAEMECVFSGYNIPSVAWFDPNSRPITASEKYVLSSENRKLMIRMVQEEDEGQYTCRGSNSMGEKNQIIYLTVVSKPIPVQILSDKTYVEHTDIVLPCKTRYLHDGQPSGPPVWTQNGASFTADGTKTRYNADQTELTITNISKPGDISCFRCEVKNKYGDFFADGCINVINPIKLTEIPPLEQRINKGDTVNLTIHATTDVSQQNSLKTRVIFKEKTYEYSRNEKPPFMEYDPLTQVAKINTSGLNDEDYRKVNGTYTLQVYHSFETKTVKVMVVLKEVIEVVVIPPAETGVSPVGPITAGGGDPWWIALLLGIIFLIIVIVIICSVCWYRKTQEGVYPLDKTERAADLDPEKDLENAGFHDLSRADDDYAPNRPPPTSMLDDYVDSDEEGSLGQYGDLDTGKFNEDGSFIGLYGTNKPEKQPLPTESTI